MNYSESVAKLASLGPELAAKTPAELAAGAAPRKFSLDAIRALLAELGNPHLQFPSVLIAGTNGKGSTAATLAAITNAAGLRTGLYTSPHLLRLNERIRLSSTPTSLIDIPDEDFARLFTHVDAATTALVATGTLPHYASFFELLTAVAFLYFAEQHIQLAILEVGLGGRLDATNIVDPLLSIITDIGLDHMDYLGPTLTSIATEKAGILRPNGILVTLSQHPEANAAIGQTAVALNVRGVDAARCLPGSFTLTPNPGAPRLASETWAATEPQGLTASPLHRNRYDLAIDGQPLHIDSPLPGQHQQRNLALALAAAIELRTNHGFAIPNSAIETGITATNWPGRLEFIPSTTGHAPILLDVAHNPAGAWTLRAALSQLPDATPRTLIFSCLADKQIDEMAQILLPLFDPSSADPARAHDHILLAPIHSPRAATVDQLLAAAHKLDIPTHAAPHAAAALAQAQAITPPNGLIIATGSIFLIAELRAQLLTPPTP